MRVLLLAALAAVLFTVPADAAVVRLVDIGSSGRGMTSDFRLQVDPVAGEANAMTITAAGGSYVVRDTGAPLQAGPGCSGGGEQVKCGSAVTGAAVDLGDGDDTLHSPDLAGQFRGGEGDDVLRIRYGTFIADPGADTYDAIETRRPADAQVEVTYLGYAQGVTISLDGVANDGAPASATTSIPLSGS